MKRMIFVGVALVVLGMAGGADAAIFSANGFACKDLGNAVVQCKGKFPGVNALFTLTGKEGVGITYADLESSSVYSYASFNGCLMVTRATGKDTFEVKLTNRKGKKTTFTGADDQALEEKKQHFCSVQK